MILFSQQIDIAQKIFNKFSNTSYFPFSKEAMDRYKIFLNTSKFESTTLSNFKLTVIYLTFKYKPQSFIELLQMLNELSKDDKLLIRKFKSDLMARDYIIKEDKKKIDKFKYANLFYAYKQNKISIFSTYDYYNNNPSEIKGRIMAKEINQIETLLSFFKENK